MKNLFILLIVGTFAFNANAKRSHIALTHRGLPVRSAMIAIGIDLATVDLTSMSLKENERLLSLHLCITLGPFGGHRLYLGTKPQVPVVYTLTLGGGLGILPLIDLFHLIFTKDLSTFRSNSNVFMWRPDKATPP